MKVLITGASGVFGRGIADRLAARGHEVVGMARTRPEGWPTDRTFVAGDVRHIDAVRRAMVGVDAVAHCAWVVSSNPDVEMTTAINLGGTRNVLQAMAEEGVPRIVFASSVLAYGAREAGTAPLTELDALRPSRDHVYGWHKSIVEAELEASGLEWVAIRPGIVVGRDVDNTVQRMFAAPVFPNVDGAAARGLQIVHDDDVHRLFTLAVEGTGSGAVNLAAPGVPTLGEICESLGKPMVPVSGKVIDMVLGFAFRKGWVEASPAELDLLLKFPVMDTTRLRETWGYEPAWSAEECLEDFRLAISGRLALGKLVLTVPWRMPFTAEVGEADAPAADAHDLLPSAEGAGEFDSPVDPRFPTFVATNLSEALPGPFTASSASVTVRGVRAAGASMSDRLRLRGVVGREVETRSIGVFGHRLYGGVTSVYYLADAMPGGKPESMTEQLFGRILGDTPVFGETEPPTDAGSRWRRATDVVGLAATGVGLLAAAPRETRRLEAEVDRLERMVPADLSDLDDARLESLLLLSRDLAVHAWVLGCWGGMFSTSAVTAAEKLAGGRELPTPGADLASGRLIQSVRRLADRARNDAAACVILAQDPVDLGALEREAPEFFRDLVGQLALVGHRGPAECEMESPSLSDDPQRFANQVGRAFRAPESEQTTPSGSLPLLARPAARLVVRHMKDREVRRDRVVRAIWVLRALLRERGRRLVAEGVLQRESDIFHLTVDEAARLPVAPADLVAGRRAERERLASIDVPSVIHGGWEPVVLSAGADDAEIAGIGVSPGKVRGLVRIVDPVTIDDLEPGEILVASVTDVGYTAAFAYAGAVVTDLGGSMSHAAVVAREFAVPCVVDTREATRNLRTGDLVEVDGASGTVTVIQRAHQNSQQGATA